MATSSSFLPLKTSNRSNISFFKNLIVIFFFKLGIRTKDQLIRGNQSHRPLAESPFKVRVFFLLCME
jgi:hypothetical protein